MGTNYLIRVLGIDLGVASIGWSLIEKDEESKTPEDNKSNIIKSGVRIFTKPEDRSGNLLSAHRRAARGQRRVINRKSSRIKQIRRLLIKEKIITKDELHSLFSEKHQFDVWELRKKALNRKLDNKEWVRVLLHIAKRRGYQSNRKAEEKKDSDAQKVLGSIKQNFDKMKEKNYETIGSMLYEENNKNDPDKRIRRNKADKYDFSISRDLLRNEIDILFEKQKNFENPYTIEKFKEKYKTIAFEQRPIKFKASMVGKCTFEKDEYRAPKRTYTAEEYVLLGKILNTDLIDKTEKTQEPMGLFDNFDIDKIFAVFKEIKKPSYKTLRKKLKINDNFIFKQINYFKNQETITNINTSSKEFFKKENWLNEEQKKIIMEKVTSKDIKTGTEEKHKDGSTKLKTKYQYLWIRNILTIKTNKASKNPKKQIEETEAMEVGRRFNGVKYNKDPEEKPFEASLSGYHDIKNQLTKVSKEIFETIFKDRESFDEIASILTYKKDDKEIREELKEKVFTKFDFGEGATAKAIEKLLEISFSNFLNLSLKAINKLIPEMSKGYKYHDAAKIVYKHHSQIGGDEKKEYLRKLNEKENHEITNPTVKRVFSQFRILLNAIIRRYGRLDAIHIELIRDLKHSKKKRIQIAQGQNAFREDKERAIEHFKELFNGQEPNGKEITKFRFYIEQHGKCIYSGKEIDINSLAETEVDHILPYSRTFDDSLNNKVLCLATANREKEDKTPFEWLVDKNEDSDEWHQFKERIKGLGIKRAKQNKLFNTTLPKKRGDELNEDDTEGEGFMPRNLIDTAYASRFIKNLVEKNLKFTDNPNIKQKVKVRSGTLTSYLRDKWEIGGKNRDNNLHHAEDAIILAFATQSEVQRLSTISAENENLPKEEKARRAIFKPPCSGFTNKVEDSIKNVFVSFAPRRKVAGAAHKETIKSTKDNKLKGKEKSKFKVNKGLAEKGEVKRVDVFSNTKGQYRFIPIYSSDFYKDEFPNTDVRGEKMDESFTFCFSLFKDELIEIKKKKEKTSRFVYFKFIKSDARIQVQENFQARAGYDNKGHIHKLNKENINKSDEIEYISVYSDKNNDFRFMPKYYIETSTETKKDITGQEIDEKFKANFNHIGELYKNEALALTRKTKTGDKIYTLTLTNKDIQVKISNTGLSSTVSKSGDVLISTGTLEYIKKYQVDVLGDYREVKHEKRLPLIKEMRKIKKQKKQK